MMKTAETTAVNLHRELRLLLDAYLDLQKDTNREPLFESDSDPGKRAERALFENRPLADWESSSVDRYEEALAAIDDAINSSKQLDEAHRSHKVSEESHD